MISSSVRESIESTGIHRCLECGKCSGVCPISRYDGGFSPRRIVSQALFDHNPGFVDDERLWTCLSCLQCSQVCPAKIDYAGLTLATRVDAHRRGHAAFCTHGQAIHVWMRRMTDPALKQNRLEWLPRGTQYEISEVQPQHMSSDCRSSGTDTLFFSGCAPHYNALFSSLGVPGVRVASSSIRLLNALKITPLVLANERCCGHDLLWEGDVDRFLQLAQLNAEMINATGVKRIVSSCPECVRALKLDYPAYGIRLNASVVHISEVLDDSKLELSQARSKRVTFHDPCRLGRHLSIYDAPRRVLARLGYQVVEMPHNRRNAVCCGTNGWTHCGNANRSIQAQRLLEAARTGAEVMVTSCLKCQIHFRCAMMDADIKGAAGIEMVDLVDLAAAQL